jgi:hypothetical protein
MLTLRDVFQAWSVKRGKQDVNIKLVPDADPDYYYFYLESVYSERYLFKLSVEHGGLSGKFISDYLGNCSTPQACYWAKTLAVYTRNNYDRGLTPILNEVIRVYRDIFIRPESIDYQDTLESSRRYSESYLDKLRLARVAATSLGLVVRDVPNMPMRWRLTIPGRTPIKLLVVFGSQPDTSPEILVIEPRLALQGNVSFGGIIQYFGLTPKTWSGNVLEVPSLIQQALRYATPDQVSNESYKLDEIRASRAKFFGPKFIYGLITEPRYPPLEVSAIIYAKQQLTSRSILYIDSPSFTGGPYTPVVSSTLSGDEIRPVEKVGYIRDRSVTLKIYQYVMRQSFRVVAVPTKFAISFSSEDFYSIGSNYPGVQILLAGQVYSYGRTQGLEAGQVAFNDTLTAVLRPGDRQSLSFVKAVTHIAKLNYLPSTIADNKYVWLNRTKLPQSVELVQGLKVYTGFIPIVDTSLPLNVVGVDERVITSGQKFDLVSQSRAAPLELTVRAATGDYSTTDVVEVSNQLYDYLISNKEAGEKYLIFQLTTVLGLHGSYFPQINDGLRNNQIGLQPLQLINLNVAVGDQLSAELVDFQTPAVVAIRPRTQISTHTEINVYAELEQAFLNYTVLSTGHTINLTLNDVDYPVDVISLEDKAGNEMHSAYLVNSRDRQEYSLRVLPRLTPIDRALEVEYDEDTEESEEEVMSAYSPKSRSPADLRSVKPVFEYERPVPDYDEVSDEEASQEEEALLPNEADEDDDILY